MTTPVLAAVEYDTVVPENVTIPDVSVVVRTTVQSMFGNLEERSCLA